jgi:hypothetical protein
MRKRLAWSVGAGAIGLVALAVGASPALSQIRDPIRIHRAAQKDRQQSCATDVVLQADGQWTARSRFSNASRVSGDFAAVLIVRDAPAAGNREGEVLLRVRHMAGVGAPAGGAALQVSVPPSGPAVGRIDPALLERIARSVQAGRVQYQCLGYDGSNDRRVWRDVGRVALEIRSP